MSPPRRLAVRGLLPQGDSVPILSTAWKTAAADSETYRNHRAGSALVSPEWEWTQVLFLQRLLLHYGIYRRYPLRRWPAFKNAWRIAFR
jgi:hypothetical protein